MIRNAHYRARGLPLSYTANQANNYFRRRHVIEILEKRLLDDSNSRVRGEQRTPFARMGEEIIGARRDAAARATATERQGDDDRLGTADAASCAASASAAINSTLPSDLNAAAAPLKALGTAGCSVFCSDGSRVPIRVVEVNHKDECFTLSWQEGAEAKGLVVRLNQPQTCGIALQSVCAHLYPHPYLPPPS